MVMMLVVLSCNRKSTAVSDSCYSFTMRTYPETMKAPLTETKSEASPSSWLETLQRNMAPTITNNFWAFNKRTATSKYELQRETILASWTIFLLHFSFPFTYFF